MSYKHKIYLNVSSKTFLSRFNRWCSMPIVLSGNLNSSGIHGTSFISFLIYRQLKISIYKSHKLFIILVLVSSIRKNIQLRFFVFQKDLGRTVFCDFTLEDDLVFYLVAPLLSSNKLETLLWLIYCPHHNFTFLQLIVWFWTLIIFYKPIVASHILCPFSLYSDQVQSCWINTFISHIGLFLSTIYWVQNAGFFSSNSPWSCELLFPFSLLTALLEKVTDHDGSLCQASVK